MSTEAPFDERHALEEFDAALARAFAKIRGAGKDAQNPHFRNDYATLASVTEACREALSSEGFSWPQTTDLRQDEHGTVVIVTTHLRRGGHELTSVLPMPVGSKVTPQTIGSAITYARRYGLAAIAGVCPEDDDGNEASKPGNDFRERRPDPREHNVEPLVLRESAQAAYDTFRKLCKRRGDLQRETGATEATMPHIRDRIAGVIGRKDSDHRTWTDSQWTAVNRAIADDIDDLEATRAVDSEHEGQTDEKPAAE